MSGKLAQTISYKMNDGVTSRSYGPYDPAFCYPQANPAIYNPCNDKDYVNNSTFAKTDENFKNACQNAGVEPTARQASKYRRKQGFAYLFSANHCESKGISPDEFRLQLTQRGQSASQATTKGKAG